MRINPSLAVIVIVALAFGGLGWARANREKARSTERCRVADAYVQTILADDFIRKLGWKIEFWEEPESHAGLPPIDEFLRTDEGRVFQNDPLLPLYREQDPLEQTSVLKECASIARKIASGPYSDRMIAGRAHRLVPQQTKEGERWANVVFQMSMPALSEDGRDAVLISALSFGPMAAGGVSVHLRKMSDGQWVIVRKDRRWIS